MSDTPKMPCPVVQTGSGRCTAAVLSHPAVVAVSIVSGAIMAASMLINDYFDFVSGVSEPLIACCPFEASM